MPLAFGAHDGYTRWEAPDNVSMAAVALAIGGGGALVSLDTTVLLTVDETLEALRHAADITHQAPGTQRRGSGAGGRAPPPAARSAAHRARRQTSRSWNSSMVRWSTGPAGIAPLRWIRQAPLPRSSG